MSIITTADVAPWVQMTAAELDDDPLALKVIERASQLINEKVWGVQPDEVDSYWTEADAPPRAKSICEQLFARVYTNPRTLQREVIGPLGETRAEIVLTGLELRPSELEDLMELKADYQSSSFWILSLADTDRETPLDTIQYVDAYSPHPPGTTYFPSDYPRA